MKTRRRGEDARIVYLALEAFRERSLTDMRSSFLAADSPMVDQVWTAESAAELLSRFVDSPDTSARSFLEKLADQLAEVTPQAGQLLEELAWLYVVVASKDKYGYGSKRELLDGITTITGATGPSGIFDDALKGGLAAPGTAFFTFRPQQLWLLVRFAARWTSSSSDERTRWLMNSSEFRAMVFALEGKADQTLRNALLHLVHPDSFEDIVSQAHKRELAQLALPEEVGNNDDETVARVRARLAIEHGDDFSFYEPQIRQLWQPEVADQTIGLAAEGALAPTRTIDPNAALRSAWLIRGSGGEKVPEWLDQGICAIHYADSFPFELKPGLTRDELRALADDAGVDTTSGGFSMELGQVWRFVNMIEVGDYVVTVNGPDVYLGVVESHARDRTARTRIETVRSVEWLNAEHAIPRRSVAPTLQSKMKTLLTVSQITSEIDELERWVDGSSWEQPIAPPIRPGLRLAPATTDLEQELLLPQSWLSEVIEMLEEKKQLVLFGPPGTGKTFLAQALADHLSQAGGASELVQFHPSYSYEDFFEGYRPTLGMSGGIEFQIKPGPLRRIAEAAANAPDAPHVLIIDEINRANIAKVFGELYFLLEYRDRPISLQYSELEFTLPPNLFIIGTMNTADRSIALVDAAMRRRFYFLELAPGTEPVDDMLPRWLASKGLPDTPARLLEELNLRLGDPDTAIGPSYFMSASIMEPGRLERVWQRAIQPLLEERFYGTGEDLTRFSLAAIRRAVDRSHGD